MKKTRMLTAMGGIGYRACTLMTSKTLVFMITMPVKENGLNTGYDDTERTIIFGSNEKKSSIRCVIKKNACLQEPSMKKYSMDDLIAWLFTLTKLYCQGFAQKQ